MRRLTIVALVAAIGLVGTFATDRATADSPKRTTSDATRSRAVQSVTATHYGLAWPAGQLGTPESPVTGTSFP